MNLNTANARTIANLIANGRLEIGEVPIARRAEVRELIPLVQKGIVKRQKKVVVDLQPLPKGMDQLTVKELLKIAKRYPSIKGESRMLKSDLIKAIFNAHDRLEATNAG